MSNIVGCVITGLQSEVDIVLEWSEDERGAELLRFMRECAEPWNGARRYPKCPTFLSTS